MRGWEGALVYDLNRRGEMCAQLFDLETSEEKMRIERARVLKARDGGLLISGEEMHYRASKDRGTAYRQTWWCMPLTKVMMARSVDASTAQQTPRE